MTTEPVDSTHPRDESFWAHPVDALKVRTMPLEALNLNVQGRHLLNPLQGFGPLYRKRYRVRLEGADVSPQTVIQTWRENFGNFWPKGNRFYAPISGIAPGEVAVLNLASPVGVKLSTGILVIFADDTCFGFMNPQGHMFAGMITFSAYDDAGVTVALVEPVLRSSDPFWELSLRLYGYKAEDRHWIQTLTALARHFEVSASVEYESEVVDPHYRWTATKNVWHNAAIRSGLYSMFVQPVKRIRQAASRR